MDWLSDPSEIRVTIPKQILSIVWWKRGVKNPLRILPRLLKKGLSPLIHFFE